MHDRESMKESYYIDEMAELKREIRFLGNELDARDSKIERLERETMMNDDIIDDLNKMLEIAENKAENWF